MNGHLPDGALAGYCYIIIVHAGGFTLRFCAVKGKTVYRRSACFHGFTKKRSFTGCRMRGKRTRRPLIIGGAQVQAGWGEGVKRLFLHYASVSVYDNMRSNMFRFGAMFNPPRRLQRASRVPLQCVHFQGVQYRQR